MSKSSAPRRKVKPCGTPAGYQRHLRNGEVPCDRCKAARADYKRSLRLLKQRGQSAKMALAASEAALTQTKLDAAADAQENLSMVREAMKIAPPSALAALSKRRQELVVFIDSLTQVQKEVNLADEIAKARKNRVTKAEN